VEAAGIEPASATLLAFAQATVQIFIREEAVGVKD
jgi:hypothetical protein